MTFGWTHSLEVEPRPSACGEEKMGSELQERVHSVLERISCAARRSGRDPGQVRLVAVTKTVPVARMREAVEAGIRVMGENYVQEAKQKREALGVPCQWHMIGHVQKNKAALAARVFDVVETVDSPALAEALSRHAEQAGKTLEVLIQVNVSGEATKFGIRPEGVLPLVERVGSLKGLKLTGLMTLPPFFEDPEQVRPYFSALRSLQQSLMASGVPKACLRELSMGMSSDFEVAIEEGATIVRVGRALFGPRSEGPGEGRIRP